MKLLRMGSECPHYQTANVASEYCQTRCQYPGKWSGGHPVNMFPCDYPEPEESDLIELQEQDPNGIAAHDPGAKLDAGKPMAGILGDFGLALLEVAKVGTFGAEKYSRGGWQSVDNGQERYRDAAIRHLLIQHVEEIDSQSDLLHLAHQAWNVLAELELKLRKYR